MGGYIKDQPAGTIYISTLKLDDTNASNYLTFDWSEDDTADRTLGIAVGGGNRVITLSGNPTLADWFDQSVKAAATPAFATLNLSGTSNQIVLQSAGVTGTITATPAASNKIWTLQNITGTIYQTGGSDVAVADGGTGLGVYVVGDIIHATATGTLAGLADVATGSVLVSGGINTAPAYSASPTLTTSLTVPTITGSVASGGSLTLNSTSHATKGYVNVADMLGLSATARNLKTWWNFEDFIGGTNTIGDRRGIWRTYISGAEASIGDVAATALRPGLWRFSAGTTTTGKAAIGLGHTTAATLLFGGGIYTIETDIYITTLSDGTDTYILRFGFVNSVTGDATNGAYFEYTDVGGGTPTPNWYRCTASNSVRTKTDTATVAAAGAWTRLKLVVNAAGTSVEYFINGVSVGSNTENIPTGAGRETDAVLSIIKTAGTTARTADVDWAWLHIDLTTSR